MKTSTRQKRTGRTTKSASAGSAADPAVDYRRHLLANLKDARYASGYLAAALEEGEDVFLLAVRDVAQARGGMTALAQATKLNRENLYDMLSAEGNPRLSSIAVILDKLGLQLSFKPKLRGPRAA